MAEDWSDMEVEIIVEDYFSMLIDELSGRPYNKAEHRRRTAPLLNNRPEGSIEFKHQNISAVLCKLNQPWINGYKPRWNYQKMLETKVISYLQRHDDLANLFIKDAVAPVGTIAQQIDYSTILEPKPEISDGAERNIVEDEEVKYRRPIKVNYLELEQANRDLGKNGEGLVFEYEQWRLRAAGKDSLAERIEWISRDRGDGLGYDILSRETNGTDRYVEVKTTKLGKDAPIYFSKVEYEFSKENKARYFLYRVFEFKKSPKMFIVNGRFDEFCHLQATVYRGSFD